MATPLFAMRQVVLASPLDERDKAELIDDLNALYKSVFTGGGEIKSPKLKAFLAKNKIELGKSE